MVDILAGIKANQLESLIQRLIISIVCEMSSMILNIINFLSYSDDNHLIGNNKKILKNNLSGEARKLRNKNRKR